MLRCPLVSLRALEKSDLDFLYQLENDPVIWGVSDTLAPVSRYMLRRYLDHAAADWHEVRQLRLVICATEDERPIGTLDFFNYDPLHQRAGVGITILATERRQGFALAALELVLDYAYHTLRLHQLYCTVSARNTASLRLFRAAGFRRVGVRRDWLRTPTSWDDAVEFQRVLTAPASPEAAFEEKAKQ
ncbi:MULTISPECIES: GNAT family N-acetyltransferase [Hymenobacter]|uniref:GNAT family N-acetyltransferase n=2 Tax=Hymenobacter TaxID=89966 RepID=A0ABS6WV64_9BACT|nr:MULTISPECIES: GNAT family protein [Hymenobacter]MBO3272936.1 GNAT family N-acetyltransferase [Hymenobacter defluvii]MBW3127495.1 GNAT family N-acetyltransferase [Hymenobacter profundi]QNE40658.1 GNAT family N-acetyltransferase [Hymenobacter sp. NBH84]